jgi:predicted MFS family arabinose efflux permease
LSGIIHWRYIFLIPAIAGLFLCIPIMLFLPSFATDGQALQINYAASLKNKRVRLLFTYIALISLFYHGLQQWLGVYFSSRYHFDQMMVSGLITVTSLSGVFGEVIGGRCADTWGRARTINTGIILMIAGALALLFWSSAVTLGIIMAVWGLGWTFNHAGLSTLLTDLPKEFLNEAASLNSSVRFVSGGIGVALGGLVMQKSFSLGFVLFGACLMGLLLLTRRLIIR